MLLYLWSPLDNTKTVILVIFIFQGEILELSGNHSEAINHALKQNVAVMSLSLWFLTRKMSWRISHCILENVFRFPLNSLGNVSCYQTYHVVSQVSTVKAHNFLFNYFVKQTNTLRLHVRVKDLFVQYFMHYMFCANVVTKFFIWVYRWNIYIVVNNS